MRNNASSGWPASYTPRPPPGAAPLAASAAVALASMVPGTRLQLHSWHAS